MDGSRFRGLPNWERKAIWREININKKNIERNRKMIKELSLLLSASCPRVKFLSELDDDISDKGVRT